jgi:tetratricopeptide (TPR) repeat protein
MSGKPRHGEGDNIIAHEQRSKRSHPMKSLEPRTVLACLILILPVATFGQQVATIPEANVQNAVTHFDLGLAKQKKGDLDGAMADYNQAIKLNPKDTSAYNNRGNVKFTKGDLNGAMADYNAAIRLNQRYAVAYNNRGNIKIRKGDRNGAMADFNHAIELNPQYGLAYRNRGNAKRKKGDLDGAIADFNRAIKLGVNTN